jgi:hypothetical protein
LLTGKISRLLVIALVVIIVFLQAIAIGAAIFAGGRELAEVPHQEIATENKDYPPESIDYLINKYNVEPEYIYYLISVEKTFELAPYELIALIAKKSSFMSPTRMDGGSLLYSTTQMKLATAKTAYMAITEYYKMDIP